MHLEGDKETQVINHGFAISHSTVPRMPKRMPVSATRMRQGAGIAGLKCFTGPLSSRFSGPVT